MPSSGKKIFEDLYLDHVEFYVDDLTANQDWLVDSFGFSVYAANDPSATSGSRSVGLGTNHIRLVLTESRVAGHPASVYTKKHGDGVADIALRVTDATAAFARATELGARAVSGPTGRDGVVTATILGFGDVTHTFVQRDGDVDERALPWLRPVVERRGVDNGLIEIDHFAVCVEPGQIDATVEFYQQVLDFDLIFTERIAVGAQAMTTKVVQSRSESVTFTLIEPDVSGVAGHIHEFLADHGGAGVQHMAFSATNIVDAVGSIGSRGVEFLSTPAAYYGLLPGRVELARYTVEELRALNILVDEDHDGQLYQIFTRSVHPRNTFFMELIERLGARSFGSGNIASLYQAVELERRRAEAEAA